MKWRNKGREFDSFAARWNSAGCYYLWGAAYTGKLFLSRFRDELDIQGIFDSDPAKAGSHFGGLCVQNFTRVSLRKNAKIIVTSGAYWQIRLTLLAAGLVENIDFCDSKLFTSVYRMYHDNRLFLSRVDAVLTDRCTLRCRDCNMVISRFSNPQHRDLNELKQDFDLFFQWVDYLDKLDLLGGEPFLYPLLPELLEYLCFNYRKRIDKIEFFSNATVLPSPEVLEICRDQRISIQVSDYSAGLPVCREKVDRFIETIGKYEIAHTIFKLDQWIDFGLLNSEKETWSEEAMIRFFDLCAPPFRGLRDRKFYYCHLECSAIKAGLLSENPDGFFDLEDYAPCKKKMFLEFDAGFSDQGYAGLCRRCHGCNSVNNRVIPGALQTRGRTS